MNVLKSFSVAILIAVSLLTAMPLRAQVSPHATNTVTIDGNELTLTYGRPYSKTPGGTEIRKIWGELVPWNAAWRMGADEATQLTTKMPIVMGDKTIPAGTYTLYLVPGYSPKPPEPHTRMVISKTVGQWGTPVDEMNDLARISMKKTSVSKRVDQFTMAIDKNPADGGILKLTWENLEFSVPFTVKK